MTMLSALTEERDRAQNELASAEIALIEATAAAEVLREAVRRLDAAVAALSGAEPAAPPDTGSKEEFERKVQERQKAEIAANPLANLRCNGCGQSGHIRETYLTAPSGASVHMLICGACNNQIMK